MTANSKSDENVRRLFADLDAAYQRAAEAASRPTDIGSHSRLVDEADKALAIIRHIRALDRL